MKALTPPALVEGNEREARIPFLFFEKLDQETFESKHLL